MKIIRLILFLIAFSAGVMLLTGCMTPQERSGYNPKPFNTPASWESRPYGNFQN